MKKTPVIKCCLLNTYFTANTSVNQIYSNYFKIIFFTSSGDSDVDQLAYLETRCACLRNLEYEIDVDGIPTKDVMRFCKGDGPSLEFECGNQQGGHSHCPGCKIHAARKFELNHAYHCPHITL